MEHEPNNALSSFPDDNEELIEQVASLEKKLADLKRNRKDGWDKVQILIAFLVPVAIAFVGYVYSQSTKEAEIKIAETNAKVAQAQLVHSFTDALTSPEPDKRKLAIEAVLLALPDDGTRLVQTVKQFDPDAGVRAFASQRLGATDLYAQIVFGFSNYEDSEGIPPSPIFAESAQLEIHLKARGDLTPVFQGWSNQPLLKDPDVSLVTKRQTVDRQFQNTVDGATVIQTNTFDRFRGELGKFSDPNAWADAKIEAIFRATSYDLWLRERTTQQQYETAIKEFDEFYSISKELRETWGDSDYEVLPKLDARLVVFMGATKVAYIPGIIARVWEHDEDVRYLHVARFVKE